jgi:hypothetical protein
MTCVLRADKAQAVAASLDQRSAESWAMPALTRRRYPERPYCWHIYYGDVQAGTIIMRVGNPHDTEPSTTPANC